MTRAGTVHQRLMDRTLLFDMVIMATDSVADRERKEQNRRCFEEMKGIHQIKKEVPGHGWHYEYARVNDNMAASIENAIDLIDSRPVLDKRQKLPSRKVWTR